MLLTPLLLSPSQLVLASITRVNYTLLADRRVFCVIRLCVLAYSAVQLARQTAGTFSDRQFAAYRVHVRVSTYT
jgi:hypothetical protein